MHTPSHLDPRLHEADRAAKRAELRHRFADLPFELKDVHIDNFIDAEYRLSSSVARLDEIGRVVIAPVGADDVEDVIRFFDHDAFAGKPEWAMCYCQCHHADDWGERTWQQNRADLVQALAVGSMRAMIARADGRVVGWVNCSDRASSPEHRSDDDHDVASILCFSVAPTHRGHGVAEMLLRGAIAHLAASGVGHVEGYAVESPNDDSDAYHGPLELFTSCGFEPVGRHEQLVTVRRRADR